MNTQKIINWAMQGGAVVFLVVAMAVIDTADWRTTKVLLSAASALAVAAFVHAAYHYVKEERRRK